MKVTTDACLFGAIVANEIENKNLPHLLDIGAGTGLLTLMTAQKTVAFIDAVEIDEAAYQQAKANLADSPWKARLTITNEDVKEFIADKKYDLIISNPPFYENYLRSANEQKNAAKHTGTLNFEELTTVVSNNLNTDGRFAVLLPYAAVEIFIAAANNTGLYLTKKILAKQTPKHNYFRGILFFKKTKQEIISEAITIKDEDNNYTTAFISLLKDYYLNL